MAVEKYNGIFIPQDAIDAIRDKLSEVGIEVQGYDREIASPHITLEYQGAESLGRYFGEEAEIRVVGYASGAPSDTSFSGATEGVAVVVTFPNNPELQERFENMEAYRNETCGREGGFMLHITMSLDGEMKAVETGYLEFESIPEDKQFIIEGGVFGGFIEAGVIDVGDKEYSELEIRIVDIDDTEDGADTEIPEEPMDGIPEFPDEDDDYDGGGDY